MQIVEPGTIRGYANETTMSNHLLTAALATPEIMPQVATLFQSEISVFSSLLANKGLVAKGLMQGLSNESYRVVGNRKVMWPVKGIERRKGPILGLSAPTSTTPGIGGEIITLYLDTNWFSPYDVLELKDNRTLVSIVDDQLPVQMPDGSFRYYARMNRKSAASYVNPGLLATGSEVGFAMTNFYEMSETGYEKYTFDNWAYSYMTIQRMKWSASGTALQMSTKPIWLLHNGEMAWTTMAEMQMLRRWAQAREFQILFGQGTVGENDEIYLKDMKGREIMAGDGVMNIGDGSLKFPYTKLSKSVIENVFSNMQIMTSSDTGKLELVAISGQAFMQQFMELAKNMGGVYQPSIVEGAGSEKGVNLTYAFIELNGVRIYPLWYKWFDDPSRPHVTVRDGHWAESGRSIFVSLGQTDLGTNNVELLALGNRQFLSGSVQGINAGGDKMKNSVDGEHHHVLCETGVKAANMFGVAELFHPVRL